VKLRDVRDGALINTDWVKWKFHCDHYDPSLVRMYRLDHSKLGCDPPLVSGEDVQT
jgi:hypothetical protein